MCECGRWPLYMRRALSDFGYALVLLLMGTACRNPHVLVSRSADDVNICRQFLAEAGNTMEASKRDTFSPDELTFHQLAILTPRDPNFVQTEFLVLNREWRFQNGGKEIVIVCARPRIEQGHRKHFAAFNDGHYDWISEGDFAKL